MSAPLPAGKAWPHLVALALSALTGCGGAGPDRPTPGGGAADPGESEALRDLLTDLPELAPPDTGDAPPRLVGQAPAIGDLAEATAAFRGGHHEAVEGWLGTATGADGPGQDATLLLARLELATGRYDRAHGHATGVARGASATDPETARRRVAAWTLAGEASLRRGRFAPATQELQAALSADPNAFRARVLLGRLLDRQGRPLEARPHYLELIRAYNDRRIDADDAAGLAYVGMAAWGLASPQDANDAFRESAQADADRIETQLEWGQLFLAKYDAGNAEASVRQALSTNPGSALAHALMARIRIAQSFDFEAAEAYLARALEIDPHLVPALVTRAGIALRERDFEAADRHLDDALEVDPNDLEALSVRAAVRFVVGDEAGFAAAKRAVLGVHRSFSKMYTLIADHADWEHRYPDIVELGREAVTLNPGDGLAHATLGLNLLRLGDEPAGLEALREAWRRDRFHVQVFNTLELYDEVIAREYEDLDADPFRFRMHRDERAVLEAYVPPHLRRAHAAMVERYGFTPAGPVRIELYASPEHFSVRTAGLPRIGVQGVCFGRVVTALSPKGGPFNWGEITWHELAHVFHIQLSDYRVPRWFTEGLAEWETGQARPEWKREDDHRLWVALDAGRLPPVGLLNRAFTHARSAEDATLAYYASTQAVTYLVDEHGFEVVPRMLRAWGAGKETRDVVREVLGTRLDALDEAFRSWLRGRLTARAAETTLDLRRYRPLAPFAEAAAGSPDDASLVAAHAAALLVAGRGDEAAARAGEAIALDPVEPIARILLAQRALGRGEAAEAHDHLTKLFEAGRDGYGLRLLDARAAAAGDDGAALEAALRAAAAIDPVRPEAWQGLVELAQRRRDPGLRREALSRLVDIDQHDRPSHHAFLETLVQAEAWEEVGALADRMIYLDPHDPRVHLALGAADLATGDGDARQRAARALDELDRAKLLGADPARVEALRARALRALGRDAEAEAAAAAAGEATRADDG